MQSVVIDSASSTMIKTNIKRIFKNITCTYKENVVQMTFYASHCHIWAVHILFFGSEVVGLFTRFNRMKESVNTMTVISHFTK